MTCSPRPGRWRRALGLAAAGLLALCVVLTGAGPAAAHAQLIGTDPADGTVLPQAPEQVTFTFNEPVRLTGQEITVYDAAGEEVASEAGASGTEVTVALEDPGALADGTYVVAWFVLSGDGHPISGSLTFSVGERSDSLAAPPPPPTSSGVVTGAQGVLGFLTYAGLLLAAGLAAFVALVLPADHPGERVRGRLRRTLRAAAATAAAAAVLLVPVSAAYAQGEELGDVLGGFDPGLVGGELLSAAVLLVGLGVVVAVLRDRPVTGTARWLLLGGAVLATVSPAVVGHTRSYEPSWLLLGSDVIHLLAGAAWFGGLVGLVLALPALASRERVAAETLGRFSLLAGGLLLAVVAAGVVLTWRVLGSWSGFVETGYGVLLLVKIGLAMVVVALGAWNRFVMLPRVRAASGFDGRTGATRSVTRTMAFEASVVVVLLGVTGFLVNASPRPEPVEVPEGQAGVVEGSVGDFELFATMSPRRPGRNIVVVQVQDESGEPATPPRPPTISLGSSDIDLGRVELVNSDAGTYTAEVVLPRGGQWEAQVGLRAGRFDSYVSTLTFDVPTTEED